MGMFGRLRSKLGSKGKGKDKNDAATHDHGRVLRFHDKHNSGPSSKVEGNGVSAVGGSNSLEYDDHDDTSDTGAIAQLTTDILRNIFSYVCPHSIDGQYDRIENCDVGDICMLCDLRDLASCAAVHPSWYPAAMKTL